MRDNEKVNVLVTAVGNIGVGNQILKCLRLSKLNLNIIGTDISDFNISSNDLDYFYRVLPSNSEGFQKQILEIIKTHFINIIFVGCGQDYKYFIENIDLFEKMNVYVVVNSYEISKIGFNKYLTYEKLNNSGITVPKYNKINSINDYRKIKYFPVVIKPNTNTSSSQNIFIAFNASEARNFIEYMINLDIDIIAQEYVGNCNSEYTIGVSSDKKGVILGSIIIRRNFSSAISYKNKISKDGKEYVVSSGITQGEIIHDDSIKLQSEKIATILNSKGPLNIQGMFVNNKLFLIEVHPMITSSVYIKALAGYNEPENIIKK